MKNMNKIAVFIGLLWSGAAFWSCTDQFKVGDGFLEKAPGIDVTLDSVFMNPDHARGFLWNAYTTLYYGLNWDWSARGNKMNMGLMEALGDNFNSSLSWDNLNRSYYTGLYNASQEGDHSKYSYADGEGQWTGIRKAWIFLENIDRTPGMDQAEKDRLKGEAKMIIACHYTDMYRHFGGLPLVRSSLTLENGKDIIERATARETLKFITDLCDEAYWVLPWALDEEDVEVWDGRITGATALGVKIRALLFGASPLFNDSEPYRQSSGEANSKKLTWMGSKDMQLWYDLEEACKEFMTQLELQGGYSLVNTGKPRDDFRAGYFNRGTKEMLLSTRIRSNIPSNVWDKDYYFLQSATNYGALNPTLEYVDMFPMADGTEFDSEEFWKDPVTGEMLEVVETDTDPFANRDPRLYETCLVNNHPDFQGRVGELWIGGRERKSDAHEGGVGSGFGLFKFLLDRQKTGNAPAEWPYLRLPEIFLSYAEALNELYGPTSEVFTYVNKTRQRVGLKGLQEVFPGRNWTSEEMLEEILKERAREFGAEEVRFFDMIRRKRVGDFKKILHGVDIYRVKDPQDTNKFIPGRYTYKKFDLTKRCWQGNGFDSKWYLSAFPINEVNKGGLIQNPGWE